MRQKELPYLRSEYFQNQRRYGKCFSISGKNTECRFASKHHSSGGLEYWYTDVPLSVVVHDLENHSRCNGSNFLSYRLLQSFQSLSCLSKVWSPTVNRFLIRNSLPSTKRKADAKCRLCRYRRPAIFFINSLKINARCSPNHAMVYTENGTYTAVRRRAPHHCKRSPPEATPLPNRGVLSAAPCISVQFLFLIPLLIIQSQNTEN